MAPIRNVQRLQRLADLLQDLPVQPIHVQKQMQNHDQRSHWEVGLPLLPHGAADL